MMNFPDSPTNLTSYNPTSDARYIYSSADGAWLAGPGYWFVDDEAPMDGEPYARVPVGTVAGENASGAWVKTLDRTILTPSGLASIEYTVPSTARLLRLTCSVFHTSGTNYTQMQVSFDGTTYKTATTDYQQAGAIIWSGTAAWQNIALGNTGVELLYNSGDYAQNLPDQAEALIMVERPSSSQRAACFADGMSYYNNVAYYNSQSLVRSAYNAADTTLRIQKLKFSCYAGTFQANSYIQIEELA